MQLTYLLPIRSAAPEPAAELAELAAYLRGLAAHVEVIVVDGSPPPIFARHARAWARFARHVRPDEERAALNGKVAGVLTGVHHATHDKLVIADDDVRYDLDALARIGALLDEAELVRPQNYFDPLPWHARWDTARTLLNRAMGGDWPGTLAVRRSVLLATGGYSGNVLFENLELVRTVRAAGGRERVALDLFVRRLPPTAQHFWSQRVRQAYDEFARPARLGAELAILPLALRLGLRRNWSGLAAAAVGAVVAAEIGRRRARGHTVFPWTATLFAPAWLAERGVCSWLACWQRLAHGGVRYGEHTLRSAATPQRVLDQRHDKARAALRPT